MQSCRPCLIKAQSGAPKELLHVIIHNTECFATCANKQLGLADWIKAGEHD